MRWVIVVLVLGCGQLNKHPPGDDTTTDAGRTNQTCEQIFESQVDFTCTQDADCALLTHPDCCGPVEIGVTASGIMAAETAETNYAPCESNQCGPVGCDHADEDETGQVPGPGQSIIPVCVNNRCSSTIK
jgi:hypothetical protein